jgi:hypothetical protein
MPVRIRSWALAALLAAACGGSPAGPTPPPVTEPHFPAGTAFTFTFGETGAPVPGASVTLTGAAPDGPFEETYVTNGAGQFALDRAVLHSPAPTLDALAAGFLLRETYVRSGDQTAFTLWPRTSPTGLDEDFTKAVVYTPALCPTQALGGRGLFRLDPSTTHVTVVLDSTLQTAADEAKHLAAIGLINDALAGAIVYSLSTVAADPEGVEFRATVGGSACGDGKAAFVSLRADGPLGTITGGTIFYCSQSYSSRTVLHELGHTYGFQHSASPSDVMFCAGGNTVFSPREELAMRLIRQRPGFNAWPDDDRS